MNLTFKRVMKVVLERLDQFNTYCNSRSKRSKIIGLAIFAVGITAMCMKFIAFPSEQLHFNVGSITPTKGYHMEKTINNESLIPIGKMKGEINGEYDSFYIAVNLNAQLFINRNISYNDSAYQRQSGWEPVSRKDLADFEKHLHFRPLSTKAKGKTIN